MKTRILKKVSLDSIRAPRRVPAITWRTSGVLARAPWHWPREKRAVPIQSKPGRAMNAYAESSDIANLEAVKASQTAI